MNEQSWLTGNDSIPMLEFLGASLDHSFDSLVEGTTSPSEGSRGLLSWKPTPRKLRLFACACVRRTERFGGPDRLHAIRMSEQYADGLVDRATLAAAFVPVEKLPTPIPLDADMAISVFGPTDMAWEGRLIDLLMRIGPELDVLAVATKAAEIVTQLKGAEYLSSRGKEERGQQAHLLRDIFGNPFRPPPLDPSRLDDRTRSIANAIYEAGQFADLAPLVKALKQDPGCTNPEVLNHCERPIRHVRGCWVVDLLSGKS